MYAFAIKVNKKDIDPPKNEMDTSWTGTRNLINFAWPKNRVKTTLVISCIQFKYRGQEFNNIFQ